MTKKINHNLQRVRRYRARRRRGVVRVIGVEVLQDDLPALQWLASRSGKKLNWQKTFRKILDMINKHHIRHTESN